MKGAIRYKVGQRVSFVGVGPAVVVYAKVKHSVAAYNGWALIRIEHQHEVGDEQIAHCGWNGSEATLVPSDAQHLRTQHNLLWVDWKRLLVEEPDDGYEVDQ